MYNHCKGIDKDYVKAAAWLDKAARRGNMEAQFLLGEMYEDGKGVLKDRSTAIYWWKRAARKGHEEARDEIEDLDVRW